MDRIFFPLDDIEESIEVKGNEFKHLGFSRRARVGDTVEILNGQGSIFTGSISEFTSNSCRIEIDAKLSQTHKSPSVSIAFPIIDKNNFEFVLKSSIPFEIKEFFPVITKRTDAGKKKAERFNQERLFEISVSALKQSGNPWLPRITEPIYLSQIKMKNFDLVLTSHITGKKITMIKTKIINSENILLIVGPEGDFTETELDYLRKSGTELINLNAYTLRSEVALMTILSQVRAF